MDTCKKKTSNIQNTHPIGHSELSSESHLVDMMKLKKKTKEVLCSWQRKNFGIEIYFTKGYNNCKLGEIQTCTKKCLD